MGVWDVWVLAFAPRSNWVASACCSARRLKQKGVGIETYQCQKGGFPRTAGPEEEDRRECDEATGAEDDRVEEDGDRDGDKDGDEEAEGRGTQEHMRPVLYRGRRHDLSIFERHWGRESENPRLIDMRRRRDI